MDCLKTQAACYAGAFIRATATQVRFALLVLAKGLRFRLRSGAFAQLSHAGLGEFALVV